jgi:hypothetical protein
MQNIFKIKITATKTIIIITLNNNNNKILTLSELQVCRRHVTESKINLLVVNNIKQQILYTGRDKKITRLNGKVARKIILDINTDIHLQTL